MSKINEYLAVIQEEIEARCSNLMGKAIGEQELNRLAQAARLSVRKLDLKESYTYDEMVEILGSDEQLSQFKESENLFYRFLLPSVSMDEHALVVKMDLDFVMLSNTVFKSSKPLIDEDKTTGTQSSTTDDNNLKNPTTNAT